MDAYTEKTKIWLDERFDSCDKEGIYPAHQPIYGFRKGHSEPGLIFRYITTYNIMRALTHLKFDSFLDVGGAEGYKAYVVKELFGVKVKTTDLSIEACKRAKEIFHLDAQPVDIHKLPFSDSEFDVVLCSAMLEHITNFQQGLEELLRVARKAVVITIPHDDKN
ncbi:MAG: class I SAM-dependent methyltransferase [Candidatus Omnitrophica bacterium]|nr:class I SAM-dependent methyltransferase [Candidatus Omnitrophota bacterium]